jgi:carbamate kinase
MSLSIITDVQAVYLDWGKPEQRALRRASPVQLAESDFAAGSMGPKVAAACAFAQQTGGRAVIGSIADAALLVSGSAGTVVSADVETLQVQTAGNA